MNIQKHIVKKCKLLSYCYHSITNGVFHSQSRALLSVLGLQLIPGDSRNKDIAATIGVDHTIEFNEDSLVALSNTIAGDVTWYRRIAELPLAILSQAVVDRTNWL